MSDVVHFETFMSDREFAKQEKRDTEAENERKKLSRWDRLRLRLGPVCVGEVEFNPPKKNRLPLYLFTHGDHVALDYKQGYSGRLYCHCGHACRFGTTRFPALTRLG